VVRHHVMQRIIRDYDKHKKKVADEQMNLLDGKAPANGNAISSDLRTRDELNSELE